MANTPAWFIKEDYLASKLAQLIASGETEYETPEQVEEAIEAEGFTAFEHFEKFGGEEKTSPNAYFDVAYYLQAKADELNANADEPRDDWTAEEVYDAIIAEGLTPWSHFQAWGWKEGVNPSADFDLNAYFEEKLQQLIDVGETEYETVEDVIAAFEEAGIDPVAHYYAWGADEGLEPRPVNTELKELAAALETLQVANDAVAEFLADAPEIEVAGETIPAGEAEAADIYAYYDEVVGDVATELGVADFGDLSRSVQDEFVAARQASLKADVSKAQLAVPANTAALLETAESARSKLVTALKNENAAAKDVDATTAAFDEYHGAGAAVIITDPAVDYTAGDDNEGLFFFYDGKIYVGQDGTGTPVAFEDLKTAEADLPYGAQLTAAISASAAAEAAADSAELALEKAVGRVYVAVNEAYAVDPDADFTAVIDITATAGAEDVEVDYGADLSLYLTRADAIAENGTLADAEEAQDLADALEAQTEFAGLVAELEAARGLSDDLTALEDAVVTAREAIENPVDDPDAPGLGITLVDVEPSAVALADVEEVFLFTKETDGDITGFDVEDLLFFGSGYTFVELASDVDFAATRQGSADVLEIFYQVKDGNTVFYVEDEAEAGRDLNLDDITIVELTGVTAELNIAQDLGFVGLA